MAEGIHPLDVESLVAELGDDNADTGAAQDDSNTQQPSAKSDPKTDDKQDADDAGADKDEANDDGEADKGYTIDEEQDKDEPGKPEQPPTNSTEGKQPPQGQLNPEQQYIVENLTPITVRGTVGDGDKVQEFKVFTPEQLPQGFKFTEYRDEAIASKAFSSLERRAEQLQSDYRNQETNKAAKAFKDAEDAADRAEIGQLQRDGTLPKFKADPESADFAKDPAAKLIQAVLDYKDELNQKYLEDANAGKRYKHLGFEEAYDKYLRAHPEAKGNPAQDKEDTERVEHARRTSRTAGTAAKGKETTVSVFHSKRDLDNFIDNLEF